MANATIAIDTKTLSAIYKDLNALTRVTSSLAEKLEDFLPAKFGSKAWWNKELKASLKSIETGRFTEYPSEEAYLTELKKREKA